MRTRRKRACMFGICPLGMLVLLTANPLAAIGQTPSSEPPLAESELESEEDGAAAEGSPEDSDTAPKRRRILPRLGPQPVTEEVRQEAVRLRSLARKFGTDPTAIVGRVQVASQYLDLPQGAQGVATVLRVDLPFRDNFLVRADVPFLRWNIPDRPGATTTRGFSDVALAAGWRAYNTPEYALFLGVASTYPTANEDALGQGKYTVGPFIATGRFLPRLDSLLFGLFQHQGSVGGDTNRAEIQVTRIAAQLNTIWDDRWWTILQTVWQIDWERSAKSSMTLEFETG